MEVRLVVGAQPRQGRGREFEGSAPHLQGLRPLSRVPVGGSVMGMGPTVAA